MRRVPYALLGPDPNDWPPVEQTHTDGILAFGGDLSPKRLIAAYSRGIFPWYSEGLPILWHCPDPRFVLAPVHIHVPKSLEKVIRRNTFEIRLDTAFEKVIDGCAKSERPNQHGTWITRDMRAAYIRLHTMGFAHSAEAYLDGQLCGGLYGVSLGDVFFGESMFTTVPDASKAAFVVLVRQLVAWGIELIDCQQETAHLSRFGAESWSRSRFVERVQALVTRPTRRGPWVLGAVPSST